MSLGISIMIKEPVKVQPIFCSSHYNPPLAWSLRESGSQTISTSSAIKGVKTPSKSWFYQNLGVSRKKTADNSGATRSVHLHEPSLHGDLDVRGLCLYRGQHRALPGQQVWLPHHAPGLTVALVTPAAAD